MRGARLGLQGLALYAAVAVVTLSCPAKGQAKKPFKTVVECITAGASLIGGDTDDSILTNPAAMECQSSGSEACCSFINEFLGEDGPFYGCTCQSNLYSQAINALPPFARNIAQDRLQECGVPTPLAGCNITSPTQGICEEPDFGQTSAMVEYSGAFSRILRGIESYGNWWYCQSLEGAQYCVVSIVPAGRYSETNWGVCLPQDMNETTMVQAITASSPTHYAAYAPKMFCNVLVETPNWTPGAITVLVIWIAFALLVAVATTAEYCNSHYRLSWESRAWFNLLTAFDYGANWTILKSQSMPADTGLDLRSLNGFRTISMLWIILSHTISEVYQGFNFDYFSSAVANVHNYYWVKDWYFPLYVGWFAIDTFLFISGLLVAYKLSDVMLRRKMQPFRFLDSCKFWVTFVFARWCRLVPLVAMVMISVVFLMPNLATAPGFTNYWNEHYVEPCSKYWWATLLFIQNLYPGASDGFANDSEICLGSTWYLAMDMQLYVVVAPVVLAVWHYTGRKRMVIGSSFIVFLLLLFTAIIAYIVLKYNVMWQYFGVGNYGQYYIKPWVHAPPYIFGLIMGIAVHEMSQESGRGLREYLMFKARSWVIFPLWLLTLGTFLLLILSPAFYMAVGPKAIPPMTDSTVTGMSPAGAHAYMIAKMFGWGYCLLILAGINIVGRGWLVNDFLGGYIFGPFAKMTYGAYLIGTVMQPILAQSMFTNVAMYTTWQALSLWTSFAVQAYFFAFIAFMVIEAPFGNLLKAMIAGKAVRQNLEPAGSLKAGGSLHGSVQQAYYSSSRDYSNELEFSENVDVDDDVANANLTAARVDSDKGNVP